VGRGGLAAASGFVGDAEPAYSVEIVVDIGVVARIRAWVGRVGEIIAILHDLEVGEVAALQVGSGVFTHCVSGVPPRLVGTGGFVLRRLCWGGKAEVERFGDKFDAV
jgi:hypothetical protein